MMNFNFITLALLTLLLRYNSVQATGNGGQPAEQELYNPSPSEEAADQKDAIIIPHVDEKTAKQYVIESAIKFSDGGEVMLDREHFLDNYLHKKSALLPIEWVLAKTYGFDEKDIEYVEIPKDDKRDLEEKLEVGAKLKFHKQVDKLKVITEKDGEPKEIDFHIPEGLIGIKQLISDLSKVDWRWHLFEGEKGFGKRVFTVLHEGHAMIALSEEVPIKENPNDLFEVARFHFNSQGLNLYKKWLYDVDAKKRGTNFVVKDDDKMTEEKKRINVDRNRGLYGKDGFPNEKLLTKEISIAEMKRIALRIIGGRRWGGEFKCIEFAYNFVRSIVPKESLTHLTHIDDWAENLRVLDQYYQKHVDGSYAFDKCQKFDFNDWVKNHLDENGKFKTYIHQAAKENNTRNDKHDYEEDKGNSRVHHPRVMSDGIRIPTPSFFSSE